MSAESPRMRSRWRAVTGNPLALIASVLLAMVLVSLVAALVIGWCDPSAATVANLHDINAAPGSPRHLLGTDDSGRDVLARLVVATKSTVPAAGLALLVAVVLGVPAGLIAGYYGGWADALLNSLSNLAMSLPALMVLMAIIAGLGNSVWITMIALGAMMAPGLFRLIRAQVRTVRNELYIDAAKVSGLGDGRIIVRHVLWVVRAPIVLMLGVLAGVAIMVQTGLDFLGLGDSSTVTWGGMLNDGFAALNTNGVLFVWPGLAMSLTVAAFFLLGTGVRDALERLDAPTPQAGRNRPPVTSSPVPSAMLATGAPHSDEILSVRDLAIAYPGEAGPVDVVCGVSLGLRAGRTLGLVGESGSGKTQTAFALLDLLPQQAHVMSGEIRLDGVDITRLPRAERDRLIRRSIGYVPQEPMSNLDPAFTIGYQLVEPLRVRGHSRGAARLLARELLAQMGIADPDRVMSCYPHQISGGMAQRVLIAGAISLEPRVLIADEPTTALDVLVQLDILDLLRGLRDERDMAILLVTHDLGVVADLCDDVAVMRSGQILERAQVADFFDHPQHEYSRALLAAVLDEDRIRPDYQGCQGDEQSLRIGSVGQ